MRRFASTVWTINAAGWVVIAFVAASGEAAAVSVFCGLLAYFYSI